MTKPTKPWRQKTEMILRSNIYNDKFCYQVKMKMKMKRLLAEKFCIFPTFPLAEQLHFKIQSSR